MSKKALKTAVTVFVLILVLMINLISVQAKSNGNTKENNLIVKSAEILSSSHISGESLVHIVDDNTINATLGAFEMPGAYAEIKISVLNNGSETVYLTGIEATAPEIADFKMDVPQFDTEHEELKPKEECSFTVVIKWDEASTRNADIKDSSDFMLKLIYTCDDTVKVTEEDPSAPTTSDVNYNVPNTDNTEWFNWNLGIICISLIGIIYVICTRRKTNSEN